MNIKENLKNKIETDESERKLVDKLQINFTEESQTIESDDWKEKDVEEEEEDVSVEVDCMWDLSAIMIRELDIQHQDLSNKFVENIDIEFHLHNKNWKFSIIMKGENLEVLDDNYTITSILMKNNFTWKIVLHAARCISECDFNKLKFNLYNTVLVFLLSSNL